MFFSPHKMPRTKMQFNSNKHVHWEQPTNKEKPVSHSPVYISPNVGTKFNESKSSMKIIYL